MGNNIVFRFIIIVFNLLLFLIKIYQKYYDILKM